MTTTRRAWALTTAALLAGQALVVTPTSAMAAREQPPVAYDVAGDANGLTMFVEGPDTRPASDDRADLLELWPETVYEAVEERADDGSLLALRHLPRALRINIRTLAPARPATGPTVQFRFPVASAGCFVELRFHAHGPLTGPDDPAEEPYVTDTPADGVSLAPSCVGTVRSPDFALVSEGDVTAMVFPFDALAGTPAAFIAPGAALGPGAGNPATTRVRRPGPEPFFGLYSLGPVDVAYALPGPYVVGSDVPPDVDCGATPAAAVCSE